MIWGRFSALALLLALGASLHAQEIPTLRGVLKRAGAYVQDFERQLSRIVAEETYEQAVDLRASTPGGSTTRQQRRRLKSDLLLMRPQAGVSWVQFRNVFNVDGEPVRDREQRLTSLFFQPNVTTRQHVARIRSESARYNIGNVNRTMNVPVLPLGVLQPDAQRRFAFSVTGDANRQGDSSHALPASPRFRASTEMWNVSFEEKRGPTLVRGEPRGEDLFSRGRLWIEPESGRVLMAEMIVENGPVRGQLTVSYQSEPILGFLVPIEMHERSTRRGDNHEISGEATYGHFRPFRVEGEEKIRPIR